MSENKRINRWRSRHNNIHETFLSRIMQNNKPDSTVEVCRMDMTSFSKSDILLARLNCLMKTVVKNCNRRLTPNSALHFDRAFWCSTGALVSSSTAPRPNRKPMCCLNHWRSSKPPKLTSHVRLELLHATPLLNQAWSMAVSSSSIAAAQQYLSEKNAEGAIEYDINSKYHVPNARECYSTVASTNSGPNTNILH